jgi:hypothetical protein
VRRSPLIVDSVTALFCAALTAGCGVIVKDLSAALGNVHAGAGDVLTRDAALEDLELLVRLVERVHPDPYRFHPREALEAERRRVAESMPASLTKRDL